MSGKIKIIALGQGSMEIERDGVRETFWSRSTLDAERRSHNATAGRLEVARTEIVNLKAEAEEHSALIDLQHRRSMDATKLWHAAHPDRKDVFPDLGELLGWMLGEIGSGKAAIRRLEQLVARLRVDSSA